jgi:hypothetical protein
MLGRDGPEFEFCRDLVGRIVIETVSKARRTQAGSPVILLSKNLGCSC